MFAFALQDDDEHDLSALHHSASIDGWYPRPGCPPYTNSFRGPCVAVRCVVLRCAETVALAVADAPNRASRYLADFEEIGHMGHGSFGSVVKVKNRLDKRFYAIKRIKLPRNKPALHRKIMREVTLLSRLNNAHVVRYYQAWIESSDAAKSKGSLLSAAPSKGSGDDDDEEDEEDEDDEDDVDDDDESASNDVFKPEKAAEKTAEKAAPLGLGPDAGVPKIVSPVPPYSGVVASSFWVWR
jgi:hypothetical protein